MYAASRFFVLFGAACLAVVVFTHIAETFGIFPSMGWASQIALGTISISQVLSLDAHCCRSA
jgi:hypothetical protein